MKLYFSAGQNMTRENDGSICLSPGWVQGLGYWINKSDGQDISMVLAQKTISFVHQL